MIKFLRVAFEIKKSKKNQKKLKKTNIKSSIFLNTVY